MHEDTEAEMGVNNTNFFTENRAGGGGGGEGGGRETRDLKKDYFLLFPFKKM